MAISRHDVGCWIVKSNPAVFDYHGSVADEAEPAVHPSRWSVSAASRRPALIRQGDLVALWLTGSRNPGIYEFGRVTSDGALDWPDGFDAVPAVDVERAAQPCLGVEYDAVRLTRATYLPREVIKQTPELQLCEQLRAPRMSNPSYLTRSETAALACLLADRVPDDLLSRVGWHA
ncbi:EVE domain-containing protein [Rhodococcus sp. NPDC003318]|uniref:EVE domain-containing protein n=1 Tax=Rhodococcus sp. NPDC003318 TaxID=3364503 RepID=UPI003682FC98